MQSLFFIKKEKPSIPYISTNENEKWGFVQFPSLFRLSNETLILHVQAAEDSAKSYGKSSFKYFISEDNGIHWKETAKNDLNYSSLPIKDGSFLSVETVEAKKTEELPRPKVPTTWIPYDYTYSHPAKAYRFDDLPESLKTIAIRHTKNLDHSTLTFAPITLSNDIRFDVENLLPVIFFGPLKHTPDGNILGVFYPSHTLPDTKCGVLLVISKDQGKSWEQIDRLSYTPDLEYDPKGYLRGGFTEPCALFLNDGSLLIIMRTADATPEMFPSFRECGPLYSVTRSTKGKWSTPTPISPFGVSPQLLRLKNGMLVLSYGRPGIYVRLSQDEGKTWSAPQPILDPVMQNPRDETCGYSSLAEDPNDPNAFFIAYSNFRYETPEKTIRKAILVQRCVIEGPFNEPSSPADITNQPDETIEHTFPGTQTIISRIRLSQGKPHGLSEGFYQNGTLAYISPYQEGKLHGLQRFYDPNGRIMQTIPFENDERHGVVRFFDRKGNIVKQSYFWKDKLYSSDEFSKHLQKLNTSSLE